MKILLVCAGGMSTSILALRMEEYAKSRNLDYTVTATDYSTIKRYVNKVDIILIGPQVSNFLSEVKRVAGDSAIVNVIDEKAYGMMDGARIIEMIQKGEIK